jgi:hypothetical protein
MWRGKAAGLGFDPRLHLEKGNQVGEEESLVGHAGCGGKAC